MLFNYLTERLQLIVLDDSYTGPVLDFYRAGSSVFDPVEPVRPINYYTPEYQSAVLRSEYDAFIRGSFIRYFWVLREHPDRIIGTCSFSNILRGAYNSCTIGYKMLPQFWHHGYAIEALSALIRAAFEEEHLHRINAYVLPGNTPSISLLTRLGFAFECVAHSAINLRQGYTDHNLYMLINPRER